MKKLLLLGLVFLLFIVPSAFASLSDSVLIYTYDDDDVSGSTLYDLSGNDYDSTITGATTGVSGKHNEAFSFDGNDYVTTNDRVLTTVDEFTIATWFKPEATGRTLLSQTKDSNTVPAPFDIQLVNTNNKITLVMGDGTGYTVHTSGNDAFTDDVWQLLVLTFDDTSNELKLYVNNVLVIDTTHTGVIGVGSGSGFCFNIGSQRCTTSANGYYGDIDETYIWEKVISSADRTELYNAGAGTFYPFPSASNEYFTVTAKDVDTSATLSNITVTLQNGTQYTNVTNNQVITPFNDSKLLNFTVNVNNYFNQTFTNYNTSVNLQTNLTQYPTVGYYNVFNNASLNGYIYTDVVGWDFDNLGFTSYGERYTITDGVAYIPLNESSTVLFSDVAAFNYLGNWEFTSQFPQYYPIEVTHDFSGATNINQSTYQAIIRFNATEIITGSGVTPANFTLSGVTKAQDEPFYVDVGNYNITFSKSGWFDKTQQINVNYTYTTGGQVTVFYNDTETLTAVSSSIINITAESLVNGSTINSFTINISNDAYDYSEEYTTTSGYIGVSILQDVPFNISIDATGFALANTTINTNATVFNYTFDLYTTNSINITFKDLLSDALLSGENISVDFIGSFDTYNYSTTTGYLFADLITPDDYVVRYSADGYDESFYYFTMVSRTTQEITLYLLNSSSATDVTINVFDEANNDLEGALVKVLRLDVSTGTYLQTEARLTNFEGQVIIPVTLNTEFYKFIIEYPSGTIVKATQPAYVSGTTLNIQVQLTSSIASNFYNLDSISYLLTFNNVTNAFTFTYSDSNNLVSKGCLSVYRVSVAENTLVNSSCANSAASTISLGVTNTSGVTYKADAHVYYGSERTYLSSLFKSFLGANLFGITGLFFALILTISIVFIARWSLTATVLMLPTPLVALRTLGILQIGWDYIIGIIGLAVVLAYLLGRMGK
jgi:hypothetical protein